MKATLVLNLLAIVTLVACGGDSNTSRSKAPSGPATSEKHRAACEKKLTAETRVGVERVLRDYETVRSKLAQDDLVAVTSGADALQTSANTVAGKAPASIHDHLTRLSAEAGKLKDAPATDPHAVRKAFGEVSRSAVALLVAEESLRNGLHIFECPMAQGYGRWIQPGEAKENPYMGQKMPACGSESAWAE